MGSRFVKTAIVIVSVLVALTIVELALRVNGAYRPPNNPIKPGQPEVYQPDAAIGYRLWPSRTTTHRYPQWSEELIALVSNSDGFRSSREFDERDGRRRVLVVGDSFVFGMGVRQDERVTELLEALEPRWRVDNMGMTGWGLDLMIRALEQYGKKADPDIVVLAVYTDDFRRLLPYYAGAGYGYAKFEISGSGLVTVPYPYPRFWERLRLVQFMYQTTWNRDRNRYDLNGALLDRYLKDADTIGFKPVVVFLPGRGDTGEDQQRRGFLREWAARHDVPTLT
ncbi:MAG: hypothetical protein ABL971_11430 [Vicinamibacterales bacterium]